MFLQFSKLGFIIYLLIYLLIDLFNLKWILALAFHFDCMSLNAVHICAVQSCPVL